VICIPPFKYVPRFSNVLTTFVYNAYIYPHAIYVSSPPQPLYHNRTHDEPPSLQYTSVALMAGALLVSGSPSSATWVIRQEGAKGPFTDVVLEVAFVMEVVVIILYTLTSSLCANAVPSPGHVAFLMLIQISSSTIAGLVLAACIELILWDTMPAGSVGLWKRSYTYLKQCQCHRRRAPGGGSNPAAAFPGGCGRDADCDRKDADEHARVGSLVAALAPVVPGGAWFGKRWVRSVRVIQHILILLSGFTVFLLGHMVEPVLQPLLVCAFGGFIVSNYSDASVPFNRMCKSLLQPVSTALFTLTGAALSFTTLASNLWVGVVVCVCRVASIVIGTQLGFRVAKDPDVHIWVSWMAFVTQAGITLGLAKQVQLEHMWGSAFMTVVAAVFVLNQLCGPLLFKLALRIVGESQSSPALFRMYQRQRELFGWQQQAGLASGDGLESGGSGGMNAAKQRAVPYRALHLHDLAPYSSHRDPSLGAAQQQEQLEPTRLVIVTDLDELRALEVLDSHDPRRCSPELADAMQHSSVDIASWCREVDAVVCQMSADENVSVDFIPRRDIIGKDFEQTRLEWTARVVPDGNGSGDFDLSADPSKRSGLSDLGDNTVAADTTNTAAELSNDAAVEPGAETKTVSRDAVKDIAGIASTRAAGMGDEGMGAAGTARRLDSAHLWSTRKLVGLLPWFSSADLVLIVLSDASEGALLWRLLASRLGSAGGGRSVEGGPHIALFYASGQARWENGHRAHGGAVAAVPRESTETGRTVMQTLRRCRTKAST
jgi:hypothetical protein